jgi:hypothetical protein
MTKHGNGNYQFWEVLSFCEEPLILVLEKQIRTMLVPVHKEVHCLDKRNGGGGDQYPKSFSCSPLHSWALLWFRVLGTGFRASSKQCTIFAHLLSFKFCMKIFAASILSAYIPPQMKRPSFGHLSWVDWTLQLPITLCMIASINPKGSLIDWSF